MTGWLPARQARELEEEHRRAAGERRTGELRLRLVYHQGRIVRAAVVPDFEDSVAAELAQKLSS